MLKVSIVGGRDFNEPKRIKNLITSLCETSTIEVVSGGAKGVDRMAIDIAEELWLPTTEFLPLHKKDPNIPYDPKHFFDRNQEIVDYSDIIVAF